MLEPLPQQPWTAEKKHDIVGMPVKATAQHLPLHHHPSSHQPPPLLSTPEWVWEGSLGSLLTALGLDTMGGLGKERDHAANHPSPKPSSPPPQTALL